MRTNTSTIVVRPVLVCGGSGERDDVWFTGRKGEPFCEGAAESFCLSLGGPTLARLCRILLALQTAYRADDLSDDPHHKGCWYGKCT
jgi:hypothetical protein